MLKYVSLRLLGVALSSRPGRWVLNKIASPHRHLHDLDGSLYMGRWRIVDEDTLAGRVLERLTGYASVRLHLICREDHDRDLHNHPFEYRTFVLRGEYDEVYSPGLHGSVYHRTIHQGETASGGPGHFHRIAHVPADGVLTLFFMTRNTGTWGFRVDNRFHESTRYLLRKGYRREHVQEVQTR